MLVKSHFLRRDETFVGKKQIRDLDMIIVINVTEMLRPLLN